MTGNEFGDDIRIRIKSKSSAEKILSLRKKGILPSPQVFRNSLDYVRFEIKILSQTKTNNIGRPSVKQDYTNSPAWHRQLLDIGNTRWRVGWRNRVRSKYCFVK